MLEDELVEVKNELIKTKEHLKKYTAPTRHKTYYENHKEQILEKMKQMPPCDKDKRKEINKKSNCLGIIFYADKNLKIAWIKG